MFYCLHSLKSQLRKGGTSPILRKDTEGIDRECIYIELLEGNTINNSIVHGRVIGFNDFYNNQPFEYGCFSPTCFIGSGIWTLTYKNEVISSLQTRRPAVEEGCVENCFEDFNQVCRVALPYDYEGPLRYLIDENGKFVLLDVNDEYCDDPSIEELSEPDLGPFTQELYVEGYESYHTYQVEDYTYAVKIEDNIHKLYLVVADENECFDECSLSVRRLLGHYREDGSVIHEIFVPEDSLYKDTNIVQDDFHHHRSSSNIYNDTNYINNYFYHYPRESDFYRYTSYTIDSMIDDPLKMEYWARQALSKHLELFTYKRELSISHKCIRYCNNRLTDINGIQVRYNSTHEVWVEGLVDSEGYVYVADIGYLHPLTKEMVVWDRNVPLTTGGYFKSRKPIPAGIKMVKIKRIDRITEEPILHHIAPSRNVLRTSTGHLLNYIYDNQEIDIEKVSMSMINILLSTYTYDQDCLFAQEKEVIDRDLLAATKDTIEFLSTLIDRQPNSSRAGSIPKVVATYSTYDSLYNNSKYLNPIIRSFEKGVFSEECFLEERDNTLVNLEVDNRALCWYLYALCIYIEVTHDRSYLPSLYLVANYLIEQVNLVGLLKKGWSHSNIYADSIQIEDYLSSTSMMFVLAMMRCHDLTLDTRFIDAAADTYLALDKYIYLQNDDLYSHSYEDVDFSSESLIYGLLYSIQMNKEDCIEKSLRLITARAKPLDRFKYSKRIVTNSGQPITSSKGLLITVGKAKKISLKEEETILPIFGESTENVELVYLLDSCLKHLVRDRTVNYQRMISNHVSTLINNQITQRDHTSIILLSYCLDDQVVGNALYPSHSLYDIETLLFNRRFTVEKLLQIPKDYTWFDETAFTKRSVLGSILHMLSKSLANWYVGARRFRKGIYLSQAEDTYLDRWGKDFSLQRNLQETQESYRNRIIYLITLLGVTKDRLEEAMLAQGLRINISKPPILAAEGFSNYPFSYSGEIQGSINNASTIYVDVEGSLSEDHRLYFESLLPIGTKVIYREQIVMYECSSVQSPEQQSYLGIEENIYNFDYEVICCQEYHPTRPLYISVEVENNYTKPLYVYAYETQDESNPVVFDVSHDYKEEGLVGLLKAGDTTKVIRIQPGRALPLLT